MFEQFMANLSIWQIGIVVSIAIMLLTRIISNQKLYEWGFWLGNLLTIFGTLRLGGPWQKLEDFILNSIGSLYEGFAAGLKSDNK